MSTISSYVKPYCELARLQKFPAGTMLMFWPCAWALTMAAHTTHIDPQVLAQQLAVFFVGSCILHCAICTLNDILDVDIDRRVERTKNRVLAARRLSLTSAWIFLAAQVGIYLRLLAMADKSVFQLGLIGLFPLHAFYPLMKRVTYWPQAWLGVAHNWGLILGWVTANDHVDMWLLGVFFAGVVCWIIVCDTIYACQDRAEDPKAGVKSTALLFGSWVRPICAGFAVAFICSIIFAGVRNAQGPAFFVISVGGPTLHLAWQLRTLDIDNNEDCMNKFLSNGDLGCILWLGTAVDYLLVMYR